MRPVRVRRLLRTRRPADRWCGLVFRVIGDAILVLILILIVEIRGRAACGGTRSARQVFLLVVLYILEIIGFFDPLTAQVAFLVLLVYRATTDGCDGFGTGANVPLLVG